MRKQIRKTAKFLCQATVIGTLDFQENYLKVPERRLRSYSSWIIFRMDLGMKGLRLVEARLTLGEIGFPKFSTIILIWE